MCRSDADGLSTCDLLTYEVLRLKRRELEAWEIMIDIAPEHPRVKEWMAGGITEEASHEA